MELNRLDGNLKKGCQSHAAETLNPTRDLGNRWQKNFEALAVVSFEAVEAVSALEAGLVEVLLMEHQVSLESLDHGKQHLQMNFLLAVSFVRALSNRKTT